MPARATAPSYERGAWATLSRRLSPYLDVTLGLGAAALSVSSLLSSDLVTIDSRLEPADPLSVVATLAAGLALIWRRSRPVASFAVFVSGCLVVSLTYHYIGLLSVLLLFSVYSLAAHGRRRDGVVGLVLCVLVFLGLALLDVPDLGTADLVQAWALLLAAWAVGDAIASRRTQQAERLRVAEQEVVTAQEQAARATVEERLRIARELHDVVAHSMSLIAVQAGVGAHVIRSDVDAAERALVIIADTSRTALTQTRSMLGLLREHRSEERARSGARHRDERSREEPRGPREQDPEPAAPPAPTIENLNVLVEDVRHAGIEVALTVAGTRRPLDPRIELTVYRVVQESLTNVLKHTGATQAEVTVAYGENGIDICVQDPGHGGRRGHHAVAQPGGHGLVGLRERTRLLGGTFEYGPTPGTGFRVHAQLPAPPIAP